MARCKINAVMILVACCAVTYLSSVGNFVAPSNFRTNMEIDQRALVATVAGLSPLALEHPVGAYDSVVAMLQSWLVGGSVLALIFAAALVAATANPLTKRRQEMAKEMGK